MARLTPPKSPMVCEKYQTGCMWRLYGLFDFRQGRSDKKLLSDKRHSNRFDHRNFKTKLDLLNETDEKCNSTDDKTKIKSQTVDSDKESKRKLKREELSTELQRNKKIADEVNDVQSNWKFAGQLPKNNGNGSRSIHISHHAPLPGLKNEAKSQNPSYSVSVDKLLNKQNSAALPEQVHRKNRRGCGCKNIDCEIILPPVQMKAVEAIIDQKFIDGKYLRRDGVNHESKQLTDALDILNSNKELFIKLIQDPNSLLAKRIEDLKESQARKQQSKYQSEAGIAEDWTSKTRQSDIYSSEESSDSHFSDRIVVLKPGQTSTQNSEGSDDCSSSLQSLKSLRNNGQSVKPANFSISQIKKKLRHAIGVSRKEQYSKSTDSTLSSEKISKEDFKAKDVEIIINNSPGVVAKSSLEVEGIGRVRDESSIAYEAASTSESGFGNPNISAVNHTKRKESEIFMEARTHLSELLTNVNNKNNCFEKQEQKIMGRMDSLPDDDDFLPTRSPVRDGEKNRLDIEQIRYSNSQLFYEKKWRLQKDKISCSSPTGCTQMAENNDTMHQGGTDSLEVRSESESTCINATMETNDAVHTGEAKSLEILSELNQDKALDRSADETSMYEKDKEEYSKISRPEQPSISSPDFFQSPPRIQRVDDSASIDDKGEQPSPVSVLEQFFADTISEPAEDHHFAPLVRSSVDLEISRTSSLDEHRLISQYVREVLQASNLDWDEISVMCRHSPEQLLDPFLFDTVKLETNQFHGDCMLLFDCIDEILFNVYHSDHRCFPWVSFIKPNIRLLPIENTVVDEVMKYVDWHLFPHSSPQSLQQLVELDIERSEAWIDIRRDAEYIVFEMAENVLEELIAETIF